MTYLLLELVFYPAIARRMDKPKNISFSKSINRWRWFFLDSNTALALNPKVLSTIYDMWWPGPDQLPSWIGWVPMIGLLIQPIIGALSGQTWKWAFGWERKTYFSEHFFCSICIYSIFPQLFALGWPGLLGCRCKVIYRIGLQSADAGCYWRGNISKGLFWTKFLSQLFGHYASNFPYCLQGIFQARLVTSYLGLVLLLGQSCSVDQSDLRACQTQEDPPLWRMALWRARNQRNALPAPHSVFFFRLDRCLLIWACWSCWFLIFDVNIRKNDLIGQKPDYPNLFARPRKSSKPYEMRMLMWS